MPRRKMISDYVERAKIVKKWDDLLTSEALSQKDVYSFLSTYNKIRISSLI